MAVHMCLCLTNVTFSLFLGHCCLPHPSMPLFLARAAAADAIPPANSSSSTTSLFLGNYGRWSSPITGRAICTAVTDIMHGCKDGRPCHGSPMAPLTTSARLPVQPCSGASICIFSTTFLPLALRWCGAATGLAGRGLPHLDAVVGLAVPSSSSSTATSPPSR